MDTDIHKQVVAKTRYVVVAKLCEPDYKAERTYLRAELAFVERKLSEGRHLEWIGLHKLGVLRHEDWQKYHRSLIHYGRALDDYAEAVKDGVLPVKFSVGNSSREPDKKVNVRVHVIHGRVDAKRKPPTRPDRVDGSKKGSLLAKWPKITEFSRRGIQVTPHVVSAELSSLHGHDAAVLINQLVHVHCGPDTDVTYEIHSANVADETGAVTF